VVPKFEGGGWRAVGFKVVGATGEAVARGVGGRELRLFTGRTPQACRVIGQ
jgi:hypothetical protein